MIFLKRLVALISTFVLLLVLVACNRESLGEFSKRGIYHVRLEDSEIAFTARIDGVFEEYVFTAPPSVAGLKVTSYDGVGYTLEYGGIAFESNSMAVKAATDFGAAMTLLEDAGKQSNGRIYASTDGVTAEGLISLGKLTSLAYSDGRDARNYNIVTEAKE